MWISNINHFGDMKLEEEIYQRALKNKQDMILQYVFGGHQKLAENYTSALTMFKQAIDYWKSKNNSYRCAKYEMGCFIMYKNIDIHKAYLSAENLLKLKRKENLPDSIKISINYNIAMFYYLRKEYDPAYSLFIENVRFYHNYEELLLIGSICTHQNLPLPEDFNKENINTYRNQDYIHYYELKKKGESDEVLVKYIMKILVPNHLIHL